MLGESQLRWAHAPGREASLYIFKSPVFAVHVQLPLGAGTECARYGRQIFDEDRVYVVIALAQLGAELYSPQPVDFLLHSGRGEGMRRAHLRHGSAGTIMATTGTGAPIRRTWQICQPGFIGRNCYRTLQ